MPPSSSVLPARKSSGGNNVGKTWSQGDKLYNNMVLHCGSNFLNKYLGVPTFTDDGKSSAAHEGLHEVQSWSSPDVLLTKLSFKSTELINRRSLGLSEACGTLETLNQLMLDRPLMFGAMATTWRNSWDGNNMAYAVQALNSHGYPGLTRTETQISQAVQSLLVFSDAMRKDWDHIFDTFSSFSTGVVGLSWVLQLGALSIPGKFAERLAAVKTDCAVEHTTLMQNPSSASSLRNFLSAECKHLASARAVAHPVATASSTTAGSIPLLVFSDDEPAAGTTPVTSPPSITAKADFLHAYGELMALMLDEPIRKVGGRKLIQKLEKAKEDVQTSFSKWASLDESNAAEFDMKPMKAHIKGIKRQYQDAFPDQ